MVLWVVNPEDQRMDKPVVGACPVCWAPIVAFCSGCERFIGKGHTCIADYQVFWRCQHEGLAPHKERLFIPPALKPPKHRLKTLRMPLAG